MTQDSNEKKEPQIEPLEPSLEPSPSSSDQEAPLESPFIPNIGLNELTATWEMLVQFKKAIRENQYWPGEYLEAVAMGLNMITRMEAQYRVQVEKKRQEQSQTVQKIKDSIKRGGGKVNGNAPKTLETVH